MSAGLLAVTVTPGNTAPVLSVTVPLMRPLNSCAAAAAPVITSAAITAHDNTTFLNFMWFPPTWVETEGAFANTVGQQTKCRGRSDGTNRLVTASGVRTMLRVGSSQRNGRRGAAIRIPESRAREYWFEKNAGGGVGAPGRPLARNQTDVRHRNTNTDGVQARVPGVPRLYPRAWPQ